jgi:hypothetical protein
LNANFAASNIIPSRQYRSRLYLARWLSAFRETRQAAGKTRRWYRLLWSGGNPGMERFETAWDGFSRIQKERGLPVLVVTFPVLVWLESGYPFDDIHERIRSLCGQRGLRDLDLLPYLRGRRSTSLWHHPSDRHPSAWVHDLAASLALERLCREPALRERIYRAARRREACVAARRTSGSGS